MFDVVFDGMKAVDQSFMLFGGFIFLLIGGGLIGFELHWRIKGKAIKGRICGIRVTDSSDIEDELDLIEREFEEEEKAQEKAGEGKKIGVGGTIFGFIFLVFPLIFVGVGLSLAYKYVSLTSTGAYVEAVVVRHESHSDSDGTTYNAVVEFRDLNGRLWELEDNVGSGSAPFSRGERLGVYYDPDDPERFVIHSFWHYMGIAFIFIGMGSLFFGFMVFAFLKSKKVETAKKLGQAVQDDKANSNTGEMYYPVFEYQDVHGERREQIGMVGSSSFLGTMPGKKVSLLMKPESPYPVKKASVGFLFFGAVFASPGLFMLYTAFTQYENTPVSFIVMIAVFAFIISRMRITLVKVKDKINEFGEEAGIPPSAMGNTKSVMAAMKQGMQHRKEKAGRMLTSEEVMVRARKQAGQGRVAGYILLLIAVGLSIGAYYAGLDMLNMQLEGQTASGEVVGIESRRGSEGDYTYHAVVAFYDGQGQKVRFEDSVGSSHSMFDRGDEVEVLYDPSRPTKAIIDRGLLNWGLSGGLALGALLLMWMGLSSIGRARKYGGTRFQTRI